MIEINEFVGILGEKATQFEGRINYRVCAETKAGKRFFFNNATTTATYHGALFVGKVYDAGETIEIGNEKVVLRRATGVGDAILNTLSTLINKKNYLVEASAI